MGEALRKMSTIEDLNNLDLPEGQRAELIDGELYLVDVPTRKHQEIVGGVLTQSTIILRNTMDRVKYTYPRWASVFLQTTAPMWSRISA